MESLLKMLWKMFGQSIGIIPDTASLNMYVMMKSLAVHFALKFRGKAIRKGTIVIHILGTITPLIFRIFEMQPK